MKDIVLIENNIINQAINAIIKEEYKIIIVNTDSIISKNLMHSLSYSSIKTKIYSILDVMQPVALVNGLLFSKNDIRFSNQEIFFYLNQALNDYSCYKSIPIITLTSFEFLSHNNSSLITEDNYQYNEKSRDIQKIEEMFLKNSKCFLFRFSLIYSTFSSYGRITDVINQLYDDNSNIMIDNLTVNIINTFDIAMIINKIIKLCIKKYFNLDDVNIQYGLYNIASIEYFALEEIAEEIIFCFEKFYNRKVDKSIILKNENVNNYTLDGGKFTDVFPDIFLPSISISFLHKEIAKMLKFKDNIAKRKF